MSGIRLCENDLKFATEITISSHMIHFKYFIQFHVFIIQCLIHNWFFLTAYFHCFSSHCMHRYSLIRENNVRHSIETLFVQQILVSIRRISCQKLYIFARKQKLCRVKIKRLANVSLELIDPEI